MSLKRFLAGILSAGLVLGLAACSKPANQPAADQPAADQPAADQPAEDPKAKWPKTFTIGFVPSTDAAGISDKVEPMSQYLSDKLGIEVKTFVGTDYVNVIEAMGSGQVDAGFLNPLSYVLAYNEHNVKVVLKSVRRGAVTYNAQILVHKDSGITSVDQLKGKKFAFGDPASTSSYLWPLNHFMKTQNLSSQAEIDAFFSATAFVGGHDNVVKAVYNKEFDGGASFDDARDIVTGDLPDVKEKVVVLAKVEGIPNDTISVRQDLPQDLIDAFKAAMLDFAASEEGKKVLTDLYRIDGFAEAVPEDYQPVVDVANATGLDVKATLSK